MSKKITSDSYELLVYKEIFINSNSTYPSLHIKFAESLYPLDPEQSSFSCCVVVSPLNKTPDLTGGTIERIYNEWEMKKAPQNWDCERDDYLFMKEIALGIRLRLTNMFF